MSKGITLSPTYWCVRLNGKMRKMSPEERRREYQMLRNAGIKRDKLWKTEAGCERAIKRAEERGLTPDLFEASEIAFMSF